MAGGSNGNMSAQDSQICCSGESKSCGIFQGNPDAVFPRGC